VAGVNRYFFRQATELERGIGGITAKLKQLIEEDKFPGSPRRIW